MIALYIILCFVVFMLLLAGLENLFLRYGRHLDERAERDEIMMLSKYHHMTAMIHILRRWRLISQRTSDVIIFEIAAERMSPYARK